MNKYSKAVKTAATVGMSLAMVLSAAPVVNVNAATPLVCRTDEAIDASYNFEALMDLITEDEKDYTNVKLDDEITWKGENTTVKAVLDSIYKVETKEVIEDETFSSYAQIIAFATQYPAATFIFEDALGNKGNYTSEDVLGFEESAFDFEKNSYKGTVTLSEDVAVTLADLFLENKSCLSDAKAAKHLGGLVKGVEELNATIIEMNKHFYRKAELSDDFDTDFHIKGDAGYLKNGELDSSKITAMKADYYTLVENAYVGNLDEVYATAYEATIAKYEEAFAEFGTNVEVDGLDNYLDALKEAILDLAKTKGMGSADARLNEIVDNVDATTTNLKAWESLLSDVQKNKLDDRVEVEGLLPRYADVEDNEEVIELVGIIEDTIARVEDVLDFVKKSNAAVKEFTTRLDNGTGDKTIAYKQIQKVLEFEKNDGKLVFPISALTTTEIDRLVEFVEDVVEYIVTPSVKMTGSTQQYYLRLNDGEYAGNLTEGQVNKLLGYVGINSANDKDGIYAVDSEDGTTVYDDFVAHRDAVLKDIDTLVEGLDGVTVNNLNTSNASKVIAAKKAAKRIEDYTLTTKQEKAVEDALEVVDILYTKMLVDGITANQTGWVNLGKGNWAYYTEDGTAFTGWVASGNDWFYIDNGMMLRNSWVAKDAKGDVWYYVGKDGAMVTNTTIDGCYINSYGAWTK